MNPFPIPAVVLLLLAGCAGPSMTTRWGPEYQTSGVRLTLAVLPREAGAAASDVAFRMRAEGVPRGTKLIVWHRSRGGTPVRVQGVYMSDDGTLRSPATGAETDLHAEGLARGEAYDLGAADADFTVRAFVKAVPFPAQVRDGTRRLEAELASVHGDSWVVRGEGFAPGEQLDAVLVAGDDVHLDHITVGHSGTFNRLLLPATVFGRPSGRSVYRISSKAAKLELELPWGNDALKPVP